MFILKRERIAFFFILCLAFFLRIYGLNWDKGYHLHPDERMIIMVAERLRLPETLTLANLTSPESPLNPNFFAYGSFPLYLLKFSGSFVAILFNNSSYAQYGSLLYVGRYLSVIFDLLTVFLVYRICQISFARGRLAKLAAFLYAVSVLPIQASHFYAVDIALTFLTTFTLYRLLKFLEKPGKLNALLIGLGFGLALATKITIILLLTPIFFTLLLLFLKTKSFIKTFLFSLLIVTCSLLIFLIVMPFAFLDFSQFQRQIFEQLKMNSNPYIFPFTLQYVATTPYLYYLKNIFFWGLGIPFALFAFLGILNATLQVVRDFFQKKKIPGMHWQFNLILLSFFWIYFLVIGKSAVKFNRYLLPLYPLFAVFAASFIDQIYKKLQSKISSKLLFCIFTFSFLIFLVWPLSFIRIYQKTHTRLTASYWINRNIPQESILGLEHWDDRLPLLGGTNFEYVELPLYDKDDLVKWEILSGKLSKIDYLILASNRLYVPLPKLNDCQKHPHNCYPYTTNYYNKLFTGELGFTKEEIITSYPKIPLLNLEINDDNADESFTVYDHPKIIIFKNTQNLTQEEIFKLVTQ